MNKKLFLQIILLTVVTVVLIYENIRIHSKPASETMDKKISAESTIVTEKTEQPRVLKPSNPADYGMVVTDPGKGPMSETEVNAMIHDKWQDIKTQYSGETVGQAMIKIKEEPQKTLDKMAKIEEEMQKCREILKNDPFNETAKNKLQNLYALKSIGKELALDIANAPSP